MGKFSGFFLTSTQSDRQTINQSNNFFSSRVQVTNIEIMFSSWSSKHLVSRTEEEEEEEEEENLFAVLT